MATLDRATLTDLSELIATRMGLLFAEERWVDLERGLATACAELGQPDAAACGHWLLSTPLSQAQIETLARHLTVGETYFWRDPILKRLSRRSCRI